MVCTCEETRPRLCWKKDWRWYHLGEEEEEDQSRDGWTKSTETTEDDNTGSSIKHTNVDMQINVNIGSSVRHINVNIGLSVNQINVNIGPSVNQINVNIGPLVKLINVNIGPSVKLINVNIGPSVNQINVNIGPSVKH